MILWTIQHAAAWHKAQRIGVLRADGRRAWRTVRDPYRWMTAQMTRLVGGPPRGVHHPVWAWLQYENERRKRPDLRRVGHLPPGTSGVLIEFLAPDDQVLLSDFGLWHYVLNRWYLPSNLQDSRWFDRLPRDQQPNRQQMQASWDRIFDLEWALQDIAEHRSAKSIQATVWEVPLSSVKSIKRFRARRRANFPLQPTRGRTLVRR